MSTLPIPAKTYFSDFAFDLVEYQIFRNNCLIGSAKGLANTANRKKIISFLVETDIQPGDRLESVNGTIIVSSIGFDTYNGEKQIVNAFY